MRKAILCAAVLALTSFPCARSAAGQDAAPQQNPHPAQPGQPSTERRGPEGRAFGTVTSVGVDRFEVKKMDGSTQTVMVNAQTHYREGRREGGKDIQLEDLKAGDRVVLGGQLGDNNAFVATDVRRLTQEEVQRMQQMQAHRAFGQIVAIDGNTFKIQNQRQGERTVVVNEQTTYMKDGQAIALKDLKVGDRIMAVGDEANGQFAANRVMTGTMQRGEGRGGWRRDNPNQ